MGARVRHSSIPISSAISPQRRTPGRDPSDGHADRVLRMAACVDAQASRRGEHLMRVKAVAVG